jgi:hypothetical protein
MPSMIRSVEADVEYNKSDTFFCELDTFISSI